MFPIYNQEDFQLSSLNTNNSIGVNNLVIILIFEWVLVFTLFLSRSVIASGIILNWHSLFLFFFSFFFLQSHVIVCHINLH